MANKPTCIVSAPPDTYSGYGARSRDFIKALFEAKGEEWDIKVLLMRWGNTPWNFMKDNEEEWGWLIPHCIMGPNPPYQPDYWFQITVPNEFMPAGKVFSCGVTAGIETTLCSPEFIEGVNRMNLTLVSSEHAKRSLVDTIVTNNQTNQQLKVTKPVEVLFEGLNLDKYFYIDPKEMPKTDMVEELNKIQESFNFLFVGHWLQGDLGEDRKNVGLLIKSFLMVFKNMKTKPGLILKTSVSGASIMDREEVLKRINAIRASIPGDLPNIYLIHGEFEDKDINVLYNHPKVKAMVNLTKGEGFGRPLLEFTQSKKPIAVSGWSGHMDFMNPEFSILIPGTLTQVHPSAASDGLILKEAAWFSPEMSAVNKAWLDLYKNIDKYEVAGKRQGHYAKTNFSYEKMAEALKTIIEKKFTSVPVLKLPTLKKI
jgi:glycosyltransferase involved in cell wall biosynthesis